MLVHGDINIRKWQREFAVIRNIHFKGIQCDFFLSNITFIKLLSNY